MLVLNNLTSPNASTKSGAKISIYFIITAKSIKKYIKFIELIFKPKPIALPLQHGFRVNFSETADSGHESNAEINL